MKYRGEEIVKKVVVEMLNEHEQCNQRKQKIMEQFSELMIESTFTTIDQRSKDAFSRRFSNLKTFVVQL